MRSATAIRRPGLRSKTKHSALRSPLAQAASAVSRSSGRAHQRQYLLPIPIAETVSFETYTWTGNIDATIALIQQTKANDGALKAIGKLGTNEMPAT